MDLFDSYDIESPLFWDTNPLYSNQEGVMLWDSIVKEFKLKNNEKVLHLACGAGDLSCMAAKYVKNGKIYALDYSRGSLSKLKEKIDNPHEMTFLQAFYALSDLINPMELFSAKYNHGALDLILKRLSKKGKAKSRARWLLKDLKERTETSKNIILEWGTAAKIEFDNQFFDCSFTFESIPILDGSTHMKWVAEMCRVTKDRLFIVGFGINKKHLDLVKNNGFEIISFESKKLYSPLFEEDFPLVDKILFAKRK